jgi:hypothetical protein
MRLALDDGRVATLVSETYDESETIMGSLQGDLRRGDRRLALNLIAVIRNPSIDTSARSLALESLAGARVRALDTEVRDVIREALEGNDQDLQFTAVAAASDLSRRSQVLLAGLIRGLARSTHVDYWVSRAANAFLSRI